MAALTACGDGSAIMVQVLVDGLAVPTQVNGLCLEVADDDPAGGAFGSSWRLHSDYERTLAVEPGGADSAQVVARGYYFGEEVARARAAIDFSSNVSLTLSSCPPGSSDPPMAVDSATADGEAGLAVSSGRGGSWIVVVGSESTAFRAGEMLEEIDVAFPDSVGPPHRIIAFDADGDCDDDLLILWVGAAPSLWLRDGLTGFQAAGSAIPAGTGEWRAAAVADYDDDGDADVMVAGETGGRLWRNDGFGRFTDDDPPLDSTHASDALAIDAGDIDQDGDIDVVLGRGDMSALPVRVHWNDGTGDFVTTPVKDLGTPVRAGAILAHDFNGDGRSEILVGPRDETVRLFVAGADGFVDQSLDLLPPPADLPTGALEFSAGEWTGDCLPDVAIAMGGASHVMWRARAGGELVEDGTGAAAQHLVLADVDDDGDGDLVALSISGLWLWRR